MGSQTTLVDPLFGTLTTILSLTPDDPRNAIVAKPGSEVLYTMNFDNTSGETKIYKVVGQYGKKASLARVKLTSNGEGKITFKNENAVRLSPWHRSLRFNDL